MTCYAGNDGVYLWKSGGTSYFEINMDTIIYFQVIIVMKLLILTVVLSTVLFLADQPDSLEVTFSVVDVVVQGQPTGSINIQIVLVEHLHILIHGL